MIVAMSHDAGVALTILAIILIVAIGGIIITDDFDWFD